MPVIQSNGVAIDAEISGPEGAPVLMLSNSLGTTRHMWDPQMGAFTKQFRVLRYDRRGHGKSAVPKGPYNMEMLGRDVIAVLDGMGIKKANWLGLSMGGMEGMWLGANAGDRFDKIILSNTSSHYPDKAPWHTRMDAVTKAGTVGGVADMVINAWLTQGFQKSNPDVTARMKEMMISTPVEGYLACCAAVRDMDHRELLSRIKNPTLIIAGAKDPATNVVAAEFIRDNITGSKLEIVEAAHIANVEVPDVYTKTVLDFLASK